MEYMENNHIVFFNGSFKIKFHYGKIKNNTYELENVLGYPIINKNMKYWKLKMNDDATFIIFNDESHNGWFLGSNTYDKTKIKQFLKFLTEARQTVRSLRNSHKSIPSYDRNSYQLKGKIALYTIPPVKPPDNIILYKYHVSIPKKNRYNEVIFDDFPEFRPNLTPKEVLQAGSFGGTYFRPIISGITGKSYKNVWKEFPSNWFVGLNIEEYITSIIVQKHVNKYNVKMGGNLDMWESSGWITEIDPYGWFQWYCRFYLGRRTSDDNRQIKRWLNACGPNGRFKVRLIKSIIKTHSKYNNYDIGASGRQGMLHWAYELTLRDFNKYVNRS